MDYNYCAHANFSPLPPTHTPDILSCMQIETEEDLGIVCQWVSVLITILILLDIILLLRDIMLLLAPLFHFST